MRERDGSSLLRATRKCHSRFRARARAEPSRLYPLRRRERKTLRRIYYAGTEASGVPLSDDNVPFPLNVIHATDERKFQPSFNTLDVRTSRTCAKVCVVCYRHFQDEAAATVVVVVAGVIVVVVVVVTTLASGYSEYRARLGNRFDFPRRQNFCTSHASLENVISSKKC